ncbi:MAG: class I SAM-dependent methyltransferase, partial [Paracoccaceae bacterium]
INVEQRDYANLPGQYDLIWCAGAAYFVGYLNALEMWTKHLRPGGAIAFSEPVLVSEPISQPVLDFWGSHEALNVPKTLESLNVAGWDVLGHRVIVGAPWAAYYDPMRARIAALRAGGADAALRGAIEEAEEEITQWEACSDEIAYGLFVVRPT